MFLQNAVFLLCEKGKLKRVTSVSEKLVPDEEPPHTKQEKS
jgi:hypothetical protein